MNTHLTVPVFCAILQAELLLELFFGLRADCGSNDGVIPQQHEHRNALHAGRVSLGNSGVLYTGIKRAAQVLRSLGYRSGSPDGLHKGGYIGSIAYVADGVKISGGKLQV